jgi:hypothetical protein
MKYSDLKQLIREVLNEDLTFGDLPEQVKKSFNGGQILSVVYVKKDGSIRPMAFSKFTKAYKPSESPKSDKQANILANNNLMVGYDRNLFKKLKRELGNDEEAAKGSWRRFKLDTVLGFLAGGQFFDMRDENRIKDRFGELVYNQLTPSMQKKAAAELTQASTPDEPEEPGTPTTDLAETKRMQKLAGITEMKVTNPTLDFSPEQVTQILANNGINDNYLDEMEGVESGSDEWMDVVSEITGKDAYGNSGLTAEEQAKLTNFMKIMKGMGIEFI